MRGLLYKPKDNGPPMYHAGGCAGLVDFRWSREEWGWEATATCLECGAELTEDDMTESVTDAEDTSCAECFEVRPMAERVNGVNLCDDCVTEKRAAS